MKKIMLAAAALALTAGMGMAQTVRIATEGAYPPFSFFDAEGRLTGFDVEIAQALCQRLDRECQISAVPWNELLPGLRAGRYALIVASMAKTAEREQYGDFTKPYYRTRLVFIVRDLERDIVDRAFACLCGQAPGVAA